MNKAQRETLNRLLNAEEGLKLERARISKLEEAGRTYRQNTYQEWKKYEEAWRPLREIWETFQSPYSEQLRKDIASINTQFHLAREEYLNRTWPSDIPRTNEDKRESQ